MRDTNNTTDNKSIKESRNDNHHSYHSLMAKMRHFLSKQKNNNDDALREAIEEIIEELDEEEQTFSTVAAHEKSLISNVLKLRDTTVIDVMIPRVDIAAIDVESTKKDLMELLAERQFSRIPVYKETLDNILGSIHIKDILSILASNQDLDIRTLVRPVPIVSPSLPVLDLLLKMQSDKKHMVFVIDEYGGIDGLVTIGDVIEAIVGEFDDEFDTETTPQLIEKPDGSVIVDARLDIEDFEEKYGNILSEEEREDVETIGGLVYFVANRIPSRGEVIKHASGMIFEVIEADQRRIGTLRIRNIPNNIDAV